MTYASSLYLNEFVLRYALQRTHKHFVPKISPSSLRLTEVFKKMITLLMSERHFNDRTAYFEQVVRDDWDKRATPQMQAELTAFIEREKTVTPPPKKTASAPPARGRTAKGNRNKQRAPEPASS